MPKPLIEHIYVKKELTRSTTGSDTKRNLLPPALQERSKLILTWLETRVMEATRARKASLLIILPIKWAHLVLVIQIITIIMNHLWPARKKTSKYLPKLPIRDPHHSWAKAMHPSCLCTSRAAKFLCHKWLDQFLKSAEVFPLPGPLLLTRTSSAIQIMQP